MWNPNENSNDENMRWCHLRAIEWTSWPLFVAQPIAPVALLFFSWWNVALVVFGASVFWVFVVRDKIVIPSLAYWGCLVVRLKWYPLSCRSVHPCIQRNPWHCSAGVVVACSHTTLADDSLAVEARANRRY